MITPVTLGATPQIERALVAAAGGVHAQGHLYADGRELDAGRAPAHRRASRLRAASIVLMHMGEYWSEYEPAEEIWVLDGNTHKLIGRHALSGELNGKLVNIAVSQDNDPQVYASDGSRQHLCAGSADDGEEAQLGQFRRRHSLHGAALMAALRQELLAVASVAGRVCAGLVFVLAAAQKAQPLAASFPAVIANYRLLPGWAGRAGRGPAAAAGDCWSLSCFCRRRRRPFGAAGGDRSAGLFAAAMAINLASRPLVISIAAAASAFLRRL